MFRIGASRDLMLLPLLFMMAISSACSEKISSVTEQGPTVQIRTSLGMPGQVIQASRFVLTVTGPGIIQPIVSQLEYSNGFLTGSVVVPAGPKRLFRIDAYDQGGTLLYSGQAVTDVKPGSEIVLAIDLHPRVPMIKVSPMYIETMQGDLLAMTIEVYNLEDISRIDINLVDHRLVGNTYITPDDVIVDSQLAKVAGATIWTAADYSTNISLVLRSTASRLVDEDGYAALVTLYYQTQIYEVNPAETATFIPTVTYMLDKSGSALPTESIRSEGATAVLYDYSARLRAYWPMGSAGASLSFVQDYSGNALHGTAYGTALTTGEIGEARSFNGVGDYIVVPDNDLLDIGDEIGIALWMSVDGYGLNPRSSLICRRTTDGPINYQLLLEDPSSTDGHMSFLFRYGASVYHTYRVDIPDSWRTVGWFHVLFSYRFGEPSSAMLVLGYGCFIDEMPGEWITGDGRQSRPPDTGGSLYIGRDNASTTNYFAGDLDEVELFDIVWTSGLVQYNYFTGCR